MISSQIQVITVSSDSLAIDNDRLREQITTTIWILGILITVIIAVLQACIEVLLKNVNRYTAT